MIAANPDIAWAGRYDSRFNYRARRPHSNHNLLADCAERHQACENNADQSIL